MKFKHLLFLSLFTQTIFGMGNETKLKFYRKICDSLTLHDLSLNKVVQLYSKTENKIEFLNRFDINLQQEIVGFTDDSGKYIFEHAHAENDKYAGIGYVKFSKCENYIVSCSLLRNEIPDDDLILTTKIWNLKNKNGEDFANIQNAQLGFSSCNNYLSICNFNFINIYDWKNKKLLANLKYHGCNFILYDNYLIAGSHSGLDIINWRTNQTIIMHGEEVHSIALSPCGKYIADIQYTGIIRILKLDIINKKIDLIKESSYPLNKNLKTLLRGEIIFSPKGRYLAVAFNRNKTKAHIKIFDLINRTTLLIKNAHTDEKHTEITSIIFSPDEKYLYSSSRDKTIKVWEIEKDGQKITANCILTLSDHIDWVNSIDLSPSGRYLASASWDNKIIIYDLWKLLALNKVKC